MLKTASLDEIYNHIISNAHLDEVVVEKEPALLKGLSFVQMDKATQLNIMPSIEDLNDKSRDKARFMLDVCMFNLLQNGRQRDPDTVVAKDVHLSTLMKTAFRSRYLVVLADYLKREKHGVMLTIKNVPANVHATRISDMLRYLIPLHVQVAMQISQENILGQDLTRIAVKYFVLSVADLTDINDSLSRDLTMERLAKLPAHDKQIIVRNIPEVIEEEDAEAFYL